MPDKYLNFAALAAVEPANAYSISTRNANSSVVIVAPHGGGIEPGTSEIALAIAGGKLSFYLFEGRKTTRNRELHITSTRFDEPRCLALLREAEIVLTVHGEDSETEAVYLGGLHAAALHSLRIALNEHGYDAREHPDQELQGLNPRNICNIGRTGVGIQLELSVGLRDSLFESLTRSGRKKPMPRFFHFARIVRNALQENGL